MKNFTKKSILQKIIITILIVMLFTNFISPNIVKANESDIGGVLFSPIQALIVGLGDVIMWLENACTGYHGLPIITISESIDWSNFLKNITLSLNPPTTVFVTIDIVAETFGYEGYSFIDALPDSLEIPMLLITPEKIFSNQVPIFDVNIINPNSEDSIASSLQSVVGSWYLGVRNLAIVGLLSILAYIAIRIIISSTATDKSKYKQMLLDWLVALCLVFFMHYIMNFSITMVEMITNAISKSNQTIALPLTIDEIQEKYNLDSEERQILQSLANENGNITTDLMGYVRFMIQLNDVTDSDGNKIPLQTGTGRMAHSIIYLVLVIYTVMFTFIYIKRLIYIVFLTMIAPLVALTYPIDKINDGKAQGFSIWIKEYIFNLLIQPVHLILYTMLLGTTMELATEYLIYPLVVLGFMLPAEKIVRKLFNFEKSSTASSLVNGALGGALVMQGVQGISKIFGRSKGKSNSGTSGKDNANAKVRMANRGVDNPAEEDDFITNALMDGDNSNIRMDGENNDPSVNEDSINSRIDEINELDPDHTNPWLWSEREDLQEQLTGIRNNGQEETEPTTNIPTEEFISNVPTEEPTEEKAFKGPKSEGKFMRALGAGTRVATPILGNVAKGVAKGTAMGIGAATLGTIGIAAGLASDDYSNVAKWGAAAAGIGGTLGSTASRLPSQAYRKTSTTLNNVKEQFQREYYTPAEYKQKQNERLDKEFMKDKEVQTKYRNEFGRDSYKKVMEQAKEYRRHGITDDDVIISAMKAKSKFATDNYADPRRIAAAKLVTKQVSNEKDIENMQKRLKEKGISNNQINDQSNMIRQILKIKY